MHLSSMSSPVSVPELLFWIAVALCAIGQTAVLRSVFTGRSPGAVAPALARQRRATEIMWTLVPACLLIVVLAVTWRAVRAHATGTVVSPRGQATASSTRHRST